MQTNHCSHLMFGGIFKHVQTNANHCDVLLFTRFYLMCDLNGNAHVRSLVSVFPVADIYMHSPIRIIMHGDNQVYHSIQPSIECKLSRNFQLFVDACRISFEYNKSMCRYIWVFSHSKIVNDNPTIQVAVAIENTHI